MKRLHSMVFPICFLVILLVGGCDFKAEAACGDILGGTSMSIINNVVTVSGDGVQAFFEPPGRQIRITTYEPCDELYFDSVAISTEEFYAIEADMATVATIKGWSDPAEDELKDRVKTGISLLRDWWRSAVASGETLDNFKWWGAEAIRDIDSEGGANLPVRMLKDLWKEDVEAETTVLGFEDWGVVQLNTYCEGLK